VLTLQVICNLSIRQVRVINARKKNSSRDSAQVDGSDQQSRELEKSERLLLAQEPVPMQ
jgi:hypothetical protein